jgi:hypothetical protein
LDGEDLSQLLYIGLTNENFNLSGNFPCARALLHIVSVICYRLLTAGSIEEKIFQRQISKTGLSGAVVDPQNQTTIRLSNEELKVYDLPRCRKYLVVRVWE